MNSCNDYWIKRPLFVLLGFFFILYIAEDDHCQVESPDKKTTTVIFINDIGQLNYTSFYEGIQTTGPKPLKIYKEKGNALDKIKSIYQVECRTISTDVDPYVIAQFVISHDKGDQTFLLKHSNSDIRYVSNISGDTVSWQRIKLPVGFAKTELNQAVWTQ